MFLTTDTMICLGATFVGRWGDCRCLLPLGRISYERNIYHIDIRICHRVLLY